jgi:hypothetical protein
MNDLSARLVMRADERTWFLIVVDNVLGFGVCGFLLSLESATFVPMVHPNRNRPLLRRLRRARRYSLALLKYHYH